MAHTHSKLLYHAIFSTKNREPLLDVDIKSKLFAYMGGIIRELRGSALSINGPSDHVHLLLSLPPALSISEAMRLLKTNTSRWVHEMWPDRAKFAWQTGYAAFSVSPSNSPAVQTYIANQESHHQQTTFKEELISFLKAHGIEYDERYLWE